MNTTKNLVASPKKRFIVTPNTTNNNNALLPNVLYSEMEHFSKEVILNKIALLHPTPQLYKLQILKNAYLNDTLSLKSQIKKLTQAELQLLVVVTIENNPEDAIICKAIFKFPLKNQIFEAC